MKSKLVFEEDRCVGCGMCAEECPENVITISKRSRKATRKKEKNCISCGHCAAICPRNAIKVCNEEKGETIEVKKIDESITPEQRIFHEKRSVRNFTNQRIAAETVEKLLAYAEKAPSSHNMRARKYIVVQDEKRIQEMTEVIINDYKRLLHILNPVVMGGIRIFDKRSYLELLAMKRSFKQLIEEYKSGKNPVFFHSNCVICICAPKNSTFSRDDCICAEQYLMLYGKTIGVDSYIVGYAQWAHKHLEKYLQAERDMRSLQSQPLDMENTNMPKKWSMRIHRFALYREEKDCFS